MSAAFRVSPPERQVDGRPRLATSGQKSTTSLPGKALNYNRKPRRLPTVSGICLFGEERAHRLLVGHARHRLGEELRARELADARTRLRFIGERNRVGDDDLIELGSADPRDGAAREHRMRAVRDDLARAVLLERGGRLAQRIRGVDDVVHDHARAAGDVADDVHHFGHVGARTALVDDCELGVETLGDRAGADDASDVRRHDEEILVILLPKVAEQDRRRVDVVDRDVEESLDLVGVEVHHHHALDAYRRQHIGHDFRGDRHAGRARAPVLPRIAEVGHARGDAPGRRAFERIGHHHDLHQVVVGRRRWWTAG